MRNHFNKAVDHFSELDAIFTRHMPIPGDADASHYLFLTAKRMPNGEWNIGGFHNLGDIWTPGLQKLQDAYIKIIERYHADPPPIIQKQVACHFDEAFLIMRDMEDTIIKHMDMPPSPEPDCHFMTAYRLLHSEDKARLDQTYFERLRDQGPVLPPKSPPTAFNPAP